MPSRSLHFCNHPGCSELVSETYCETHKAQHAKEYDKRRGSSRERGYTTRWEKYRAWFLKQPGNQICKLHLPGCTLVADCVDHIDPPDNANDPRFWDMSNHQASCIHCNSVKGHTKMIGEYEL